MGLEHLEELGLKCHDKSHCHFRAIHTLCNQKCRRNWFCRRSAISTVERDHGYRKKEELNKKLNRNLKQRSSRVRRAWTKFFSWIYGNISSLQHGYPCVLFWEPQWNNTFRYFALQILLCASYQIRNRSRRSLIVAATEENRLPLRRDLDHSDFSSLFLRMPPN